MFPYTNSVARWADQSNTTQHFYTDNSTHVQVTEYNSSTENISTWVHAFRVPLDQTNTTNARKQTNSINNDVHLGGRKYNSNSLHWSCIWICTLYEYEQELPWKLRLLTRPLWYVGAAISPPSEHSFNIWFKFDKAKLRRWALPAS